MSRRKTAKKKNDQETPSTTPAHPRPSRLGAAARAFAATLVVIVVIGTAAILLFSTFAGNVVAGEPVSGLYDPDRVGGMPVTDGPSGLRGDAAAPEGTVIDTNNSDADKLALQSVNDVEEFWKQAYNGLDGAFRPVQTLVSYDSTDPAARELCGSSPYKNPNAFYCHSERMIAWDRGALVPTGQKYFGTMSIPALLAHEYGHAVQRMAGLVNRRTPTIVFEQQADCFAGSYMRWVAEGNSKRFTINTGDGLNRVLAAAIAIRDPLITPEYSELVEDGHGTALDRVTAFQMGFTTGNSACTEINLDEIDQRRANLPIALQEDDKGNLQSPNSPINEETLTALMELLNTIYTPANAPKLAYDAAPCPDGQDTKSPADYCPATNTITVDLSALKEIGASGDESKGVLLQGDNSAMSIVTSRYMQALQHAHGASLTGASAALRTACMTGLANRDMSEPVKLPSGNTFQLTAGDLDEAVAGLLTNGWVASDKDGNTVPAGFTRIAAFRSGLTGNAEQCYQRFP
ncbi:peptidase [Mycolicibacterium peregrinum]|uniref:Lipoprotein peptidase LpqM n=1 Tax=Mycolicibacterium alvei TaxID=67081 RepID=A0A6N4V0C9_9MYCO|nr:MULTISPECIES: neutral zinc metallopeptidase [Mycolicibacterium]MCV7003434.1 neutral zinc metallopeptidase [Mycolicibacterium alvei]OWL98802.1 peptidase [Mycolicibacterium peregrinum]BBX30620.1 lipoprotein peptidase LpqM [Mycolicibacterium alvei]